MNIKVHLLEDHMCKIIDSDNYTNIEVWFDDKIVVFKHKSGMSEVYPGSIRFEFGPFEDIPEKFSSGDD